MAVLGDRGTGVLDMLIEGFRRSGADMPQPNMSPVGRTPLQQVLNRPEVAISASGNQMVTTMPDMTMAQASPRPMLSDVTRGRILDSNDPMRPVPQPMPIQQVVQREQARMGAPAAPQQSADPMGMGKLASDADRLVKAGAAESTDPSIRQRIQDVFGGRENMLRLAMAFNTMRLEPDAQLTAALSKQLENVGVSGRAQQIAQALRAKGTPAALSAADYIERTGDYKGGYKMFRESGKVRQVSGAELNTQSGTTAYDETKMYNQNTVTGQLTAVGSGGINIELPSEGADKKLFEQVGKGSGDLVIEQAKQLPDLQNQVANLQILDQLSEAMAQGTTGIPDFLKGSVPEGMNSSIDAYRAIVFTVAQGLRQAGTGPMTDRDFDILVSRAGSISADVNARRIAQAALRRATNNALRRARIADNFRLNPTEEGQQKYRVEIETLNQELEKGILTPNERTLLSQMGPQGQQPVYDTSNMNQATATYFNSLSAPAQAYFMSQSPAKQQELVNSGATR